MPAVRHCRWFADVLLYIRINDIGRLGLLALAVEILSSNDCGGTRLWTVLVLVMT